MFKNTQHMREIDGFAWNKFRDKRGKMAIFYSPCISIRAYRFDRKFQCGRRSDAKTVNSAAELKLRYPDIVHVLSFSWVCTCVHVNVRSDQPVLIRGIRGARTTEPRVRKKGLMSFSSDSYTRNLIRESRVIG